MRTSVLSLGSSALKLGLGKQSDVQLIWTPFTRVRTKNGGARSSVSGIGDVQLRFKHGLTGTAARVQVAAIPFVKLPVAKRGIGNRTLEGGLAVPVSIAAGAATVTLGPELDVLADGDGRGRHLALVNLINVAGPIAPRLTLAGELWSNLNFDPAGTLRQASADAALAYAVSNDLQLDAGANLGLNANTPDIEVYVGTSIRF